MKGLKPVKQNTDSTLIASSVAAELQAAIANVNSQITAINNELESINAQLDTDAVNEESGTFDTLNARNANVSNKLNVSDKITARKVEATTGIETPRVDADVVSVNSVSADTVSANRGNFDNLSVSQCITTPRADITDANITNLSSTNVNLENISTQSINTPAAEVGTLRVQNLQNLAEFSSSVVNANREINAPQVNTDTANITSLQANMAKMDALFTQNIEFNTDENDVTQYVLLDPPVDSSNGNNDPVYIEMPAIASGFYRINVKKQNGKYFAVTLINTESTPIVQYDKDEDADIDYLFYDTITNTLYVKTFAAGKIFWANDSKRTAIAPKTYAELPVDSSLETTLKYRAGGKRRVVVMGNNQLDYGLAVQGVLEATMIKENAAYHQLFFYGDSFEALMFLCDKYLKYEDPITHQITYTTSQANGYLWHKDDTYRDSDSNEVEAIDYIKYDGGTVAIGVNDRVGHDEIDMDPLLPGEIILPREDITTMYNKLKPLGAYTGHWYRLYGIHHEFTMPYPVALELPGAVITFINGNGGTVTRTLGENELMLLGGVSLSMNDRPWQLSVVNKSNIEADGKFSGDDYYFGGSTLTINSDNVTPTPETLPFVLSFTMSAITWDKLMNEEIFNSWGMDRS